MPKHSIRLASALALFVAAALTASAHPQGLPPPPKADAPSRPGTDTMGPSAFDVASVHEHRSDEQMMSWREKPDGIQTENIPLQSLISSAYNVKNYLISGGPSWVNSKGFDLDAKLLPTDDGKPVKLTEAQREILLRNLLADRFHLQVHLVTKTLPVYDLILARGGLKMKSVPPLPADATPEQIKNRGSMYFSPGHLEAKAYRFSSLPEQLSYTVERTIVDKTGVKGDFDFTLNWTPDEQMQTGASPAQTGAEAKPNFFTALEEQLGLKLVPDKGPVDTLVIDHVELPTAN